MACSWCGVLLFSVSILLDRSRCIGTVGLLGRLMTMIRVCIALDNASEEGTLAELIRAAEAGEVQAVAAAISNQGPHADALARLKALGAEIHEEPRAMLEATGGRADLCLIDTGILSHFALTIAAMRAGLNVLIVPPAAATVDEVREMESVADETGLLAAVGFPELHAPQTHILKQILMEGILGRIESIKCRALWPRDDAYYTRNAWAGRLRIDGQWVLDSPANGDLAPTLMQLLFLAGPTDRESALPHSIQSELYRAHPIESPDTVAMRIRTDMNTPLLFLATHACRHSQGPEFELVGTLGRMHQTPEITRIETFDGLSDAWPTPSIGEMRAAVLTSVAQRLAGDGTFVCDIGIAAQHTLAVNGAHSAAKVREIPGEFLERIDSDRLGNEAGGGRWIVKDIEEVFAQCWKENKLPGELKTPWAKSWPPVSVEGLESFRAC